VSEAECTPEALPKADRRFYVGNGCAPATNVDRSLDKEKKADGREVLSQLPHACGDSRPGPRLTGSDLGCLASSTKIYTPPRFTKNEPEPK
jgi:hypothetical protein